MASLRLPLALIGLLSIIAIFANVISPFIGPLEYTGHLTYQYVEGDNPIVNVVFQFNEEIGEPLIVVSAPSPWSWIYGSNILSMTGGSLAPSDSLVVTVSFKWYVPPGDRPFTAVGTTSGGESSTAVGVLAVTEMLLLRILYILSRNKLYLTAVTVALFIVEMYRRWSQEQDEDLYSDNVFPIQEDPTQPDTHKILTGICVRFFIIDDLGAKDRSTRPKKGLLKGAEYSESNFGKVSQETVEKIKELLEKVNKIWAECKPLCCWVQFFLCEKDGELCIYTLDLKGLYARNEYNLHFFYNENYAFKYKWKREIDLAKLFDTPREIKTRDGTIEGTIEQSATWSNIETFVKSLGLPETKNGDAVDSIVKDMLKKKIKKTKKELENSKDQTETMKDNPLYEKDSKVREKLEKMLQKSERTRIGILNVLGQAVDSKKGKKCINVFIIRDYENISKPGDEAGLGTLGGRNSLVDESAFRDNGSILAHELGHNLSLRHPRTLDPEKLMNKGGGFGAKLTQPECQQACIHLTKENLRSAIIPREEAKRRYEAEKEEKKRKLDRTQMIEKIKELQQKAQIINTKAEEEQDKADKIRKEMADNPELKDAEEELAEAEKDLQRERLMKRYRTPKSRTRQMNRKIKDAERSRARAEKASTPSAKDKLEASAKKADLDAEILEGLIESGEETTTKGVANAKKKIEEAEAKIKEVQSKVEAGANKRALEHEKKAKQLKREAEQLEKEAENLKTT